MKPRTESAIWNIKQQKTNNQNSKKKKEFRGRLGGKGIKQKGKRTHGHGQQCGDCWGARSIKGLNGNGKKIQQRLNFKKKKIQKNEDSVRSLLDNLRHTNIHIIGCQRKRERARN